MEILPSSSPSRKDRVSSLVSNDAIFSLDRDVLWQIFSINADMADDSEGDLPAIGTLRHTSQVCSVWRNHILNASSLWGRVIDFNFLRHENWRNEVIHRTGSSDLFIRGGRAHWRIDDVIIAFLQENWSRIRSLDLDLDYNYPETLPPALVDHKSDLWRLLKNPSNVLESFQLSLPSHNPVDQSTRFLSPPDFIIFDNHAPSLGIFFAPAINFDLQAPWTSHIRHLSLNAPIHVHELLEALTAMPLLETLDNRNVEDLLINGEANLMRKVAVPRLKNLIFETYTDISPYMAFLAHIEPLENRVLSFTYRGYDPSEEDYPGPNEQDVAAAMYVLYTYSMHAPLPVSTQVFLRLREYRFHFYALLPDKRTFSFDFYHEPESVMKLWNTLNIHDFFRVHYLSLTLQDSSGIHPSNHKLHIFIFSLRSVNILDISTATLEFILRFPYEVLQGVFPVLREIILWNLAQPDVITLQTLLAMRVATGRPISALTVKLGRFKIDLKSLDGFTGLKVSFTGKCHKEYVCGSGHSEELLWEAV